MTPSLYLLAGFLGATLIGVLLLARLILPGVRAASRDTAVANEHDVPYGRHAHWYSSGLPHRLTSLHLKLWATPRCPHRFLDKPPEAIFDEAVERLIAESFDGRHTGRTYAEAQTILGGFPDGLGETVTTYLAARHNPTHLTPNEAGQHS